MARAKAIIAFRRVESLQYAGDCNGRVPATLADAYNPDPVFARRPSRIRPSPTILHKRRETRAVDAGLNNFGVLATVHVVTTK